MSNFSTSHKYAPGLGGKTNGQIDRILRSWREHGIGVIRAKEHRRGR